MANYQENLRKIRGEAIYGPEMREAIAEAIEQADDSADARLTAVENLVNSRELFIHLEPLGGDDHQLVIVNAS